MKAKHHPFKFIKNNFKTIIGLSFLLLLLVYGAYCTCGYYLSKPGLIAVNIAHLALNSGIYLLLLFTTIIYSIYIRQKRIINIWGIIIFTAIFALQIMVFVLSEDFFSMMINGQAHQPALIVGELDPTKRAYYLIRCLDFLLTMYLLLFIYPAYFNTRHRIAFVCFVALTILVSSIIYSLSTEIETHYKEFFIHFYENPREYAPKSFFTNINNFALVLFVGVICCCYLHNIYHKWWILIFAAIFALYQFFTLCKTSILLTVIFFTIYAFYRFVFTFKKHKIRNTITAFIFIAMVASIGLGLGLTSARDYIGNMFKEGSWTFSLRINAWSSAGEINARSPLHIIFGSGYGYINDLLLQTRTALSLENQFVQEFANAGIVGIFATLGLIIFGYYSFIKRTKKDAELYIFLTLFMTIMIPYLFVEAVV